MTSRAFWSGVFAQEVVWVCASINIEVWGEDFNNVETLDDELFIDSQRLQLTKGVEVSIEAYLLTVCRGVGSNFEVERPFGGGGGGF